METQEGSGPAQGKQSESLGSSSDCGDDTVGLYGCHQEGRRGRMDRVQSKRSAQPPEEENETTPLILDAAPLIYLCKVSLAQHLRSLITLYRFFTTQEVYREVYLNGVEKNVFEVEVLKDLFEGGIINILSEEEKDSPLDHKLLRASGLHKGEISVIQSALLLGATAIIDDKRARNVAKSMKVNLGGTVSIVIELVKIKAISKSEAKEAVSRMVSEGWYCSAKDYIFMMKAIDDA